MKTPLVITICATRSYTYAMEAQARRVVGCLTADPARWPSGVVVLVGDKSSELSAISTFYETILPGGWTVQLLAHAEQDGLPNYKEPAQLLIARLRSRACDEARRLGAPLCWSLDADVLPPENALRCMADMLAFDAGYYAVATCPYPSQGGGDFLGGRGTEQRPILPDVYEDERNLPTELSKRIERSKAAQIEAAKAKEVLPAEWQTEYEAIQEEIKKSPPKGSVWELNAKKYRRRGWMSAAYPGIGLGAVLPSDWCGFGCTLMNRQALSLAQWDGYDGRGTEDLYVCWKRWYKAGLKICVIPHAPCDHVIRNPDKPKLKEGEERKLEDTEKPDYILCQARHETNDPECVGHLRQERRTWI